MRRPRPYVPLSVDFHLGKTGTAIMEKFGYEGLAVWVIMLAAAKDWQTGPEGEIMFRGEDDWGAIGLAAYPPSFTLEEFLTFLGTRKQTRRTREGRKIYVIFTQWERWNDMDKREIERQRKARYRQQLKRDTVPDMSQASPIPERDSSVPIEVDIDIEGRRVVKGPRFIGRDDENAMPDDVIDPEVPIDYMGWQREDE